MAFAFKFSADGSEFTRGLNKMKGEVKSFAKSAGRIMGAMFVGAAIVGLKKMVNELDRVGKLSARIGKSAESLQRVAFAANLAGTDIENVANALTKIEQNAGQAMNGLTTYSDAFDRLLIDHTTFAQLSPEEQITKMAAAYQEAKKSGTGMADVLTIIGGRAKELLPLLSQTPEQLEATFNAAHVAGSKVIKNAEKLNDTMTTLKNKGFGVVVWFIGLLDEAGTGFAVMITAVVEGVKLVVTEFSIIGDIMSKATRGDWGGVKDSLKQMRKEGDKTFNAIGNQVDSIHAKRRGGGGAPSKGGLTSGGVDSIIEDDKARKRTIQDIDKLEEELAKTERKISMDKLSNAAKQKALSKEKNDAEKVFLDLQGKALDNEIEGGERKSAIFLKELEAKKELLRIAQELAGVEAKIAADGKIEAAKIAADALRVKQKSKSANETAIDSARSHLASGESNLSSLKGSSVDSGVIASGLRSIGGGGSAVVTRDPALQIAKRSQQILAQIAANTATAAAVEELTRTQQEF